MLYKEVDLFSLKTKESFDKIYIFYSGKQRWTEVREILDSAMKRRLKIIITKKNFQFH